MCLSIIAIALAFSLSPQVHSDFTYPLDDGTAEHVAVSILPRAARSFLIILPLIPQVI